MHYNVNMESLIIASKNKKEREDYAITLCKKRGIESIDIRVHNPEGTIGIAGVRDFQKTLFLTPIKSHTKACIISDAHNLTIEAQNALLKILEEPPNNTIIVLTAENKEVLLPTILSRCKVIELKSSENQSESSDLSSFISQLSTLTEGGVGHRLKLAQDLAKNKDDAIAWLEKMILSLRQEFIKDPSNSSLFIIYYSLFQKTYVTLKTTNANPRLVLENLFLNM